MISHLRWYMVLALLLILMGACRRVSIPKEYGYCRIDLPMAQYTSFPWRGYPYRFEYNTRAQLHPIQQDKEVYWLNIDYPDINATIHCSYKPVCHNLGTLSADAQEFVYNHAMKASKIDQTEYVNDTVGVYGILYELEGNTASCLQFFLTDSLHHFFRGAVYFNCKPNQDSLAPMMDYVRQDAIHMIESFQWQ